MNTEYLLKKPNFTILKIIRPNLSFSQSVIVLGAKCVKLFFSKRVCQVHKQSIIE